MTWPDAASDKERNTEIRQRRGKQDTPTMLTFCRVTRVGSKTPHRKVAGVAPGLPDVAEGAKVMAKMMLYDTDSGKPVGETEIPDEVLAAAVKVEDWLKSQPSGVVLYGVTLAD